MTIAIDASRAVNEKAGIGRLTKELIKSLIKTDRKNQYLLIFTYFRKSAKKEREIAEFKGENVVIKRAKLSGSVKEQIWGWNLPFFNRIYKEADILLAPSFFEFKFGLKIPQVVIIHDMTTFLFPDQRGKRVSERLSKRAILACKKAQKVIAISESTKKDILKFTKISAKKVEVIYPGLTRFKKIAKNLPKKLKNKHYILSVGTLEPRKNLRNLLLAYDFLPLNLKNDYKLVICGAKGWNMGKIQETRNKKQNAKIIFLGYVPDDVLAKLYKEAKVFVYPSLYEGFGLPVIEAMQFDAPVITSDLSSLPEAAGDAAYLINPSKPKAISKALQAVLEGKIKLNRGLEQARKFNWSKTTREVIELLEEVENG